MSHATSAPAGNIASQQLDGIGYAVGFSTGTTGGTVSGTLTFSFIRTGKILTGYVEIVFTASPTFSTPVQIDDVTSHGAGANTKFLPVHEQLFALFVNGGGAGNDYRTFCPVTLKTNGVVMLNGGSTSSTTLRFASVCYESPVP